MFFPSLEDPIRVLRGKRVAERKDTTERGPKESVFFMRPAIVSACCLMEAMFSILWGTAVQG